jgi:tRNA (cmo5U34)-methyltransferase
LIQDIYTALTPGGMLLLSEKVYHPRNSLDVLQKEFHHRFKRENGYTALEISQKSDALEKVLIPETVESHEARLIQAGFIHLDIWLKWFNFCSWICLK